METVDQSVARGAIWVNAAGNDALTAWFDVYSDPDGDGPISFGGQNDEVMNIPLRECGDYWVQLRWEDTWAGASTDLNLYLFNQYTGEVVSFSEDEQSGESGQVPFEAFSYQSPVDSNGYGVVVVHNSGDAPDWIQMVVWGVGSIEHFTANGSITNPAESANPGMLAVGAAPWNDVHTIEYYSSRGPTPDGRIKPDVVGAACGVTARISLNESHRGFCGTSQAAPHVAGMAALVRQRFPNYTPAQVASYLKDNAQQRRSPDPNNTWGHGFAILPPPDGTASPAPAPSDVFTRKPAAEFDTLTAASNRAPRAIWSDGETMWVTDYSYRNEKIYAYDMATKARVSGKDFDTLQAADNTGPLGIWSDGETMWVSDIFNEKIYAYDMATKARVSGKDFDTLAAAGNTAPYGIWSDGATMWVVDWDDSKIYAYDMATKARVSGEDFDFLKAAGNLRPRGIWSDGTTTWVSDSEEAKIYAYYTERDVLAALYDATAGAGWTNSANWLTGKPVGQWHGVTVDASGRVSGLELPDNALSGQIPADLGNLANLEQLRLNGNRLTGEIPNALGFLENLTLLHLAGNQLTGCVPAALMNVEDTDFALLGLDFCLPATAARSFSATTVPPGGQVTVSITAADYGGDGQVSETLPPGFAYVSSSLPEDQVTVTGQVVQEVTFALAGETSFTYTATASGSEGPHTFSGTVQDSAGNDYPVGGADVVSVSLRDWLLLRYDADGSGSIEAVELSSAIDDYFAGLIDARQLSALIDLYFEGPAPASEASGHTRTDP